MLELGKTNGVYGGLIEKKKTHIYLHFREKEAKKHCAGLLAIFKIFQQGCINHSTDLTVRGSNLLPNTLLASWKTEGYVEVAWRNISFIPACLRLRLKVPHPFAGSILCDCGLLKVTFEGKVPVYRDVTLTHSSQQLQRCSACQMEMQHIPLSIIFGIRNITDYSPKVSKKDTLTRMPYRFSLLLADKHNII